MYREFKCDRNVEGSLIVSEDKDDGDGIVLSLTDELFCPRSTVKLKPEKVQTLIEDLSNWMIS